MDAQKLINRFSRLERNLNNSKDDMNIRLNKIELQTVSFENLANELVNEASISLNEIQALSRKELEHRNVGSKKQDDSGGVTSC